MINYAEFKETLKTDLTDVLTARGHEVDITDVSTPKANRTLDGISIRLDNAPVAPTIYTQYIYDHTYDEGVSIREIAEGLADTAERSYDQFIAMGVDTGSLNADFVLKNAYLVVVNTGLNDELLSRVPHTEIPGTDLSAYAKVTVGKDAFVTITNDLAFNLGLTGSEILDSARTHTLQQHYQVQSLYDTLSGLMPDDMGEEGLFPCPQEEIPSMVVITNEQKLDGANAILVPQALDDACALMGCDTAVILPSSRHELLAVSLENLRMGSTADLKHMVEEVNATQVSIEDQLSDNIYRYNCRSHELTLCNDQGLFPDNGIETDMHQGIHVGASIAM